MQPVLSKRHWLVLSMSKGWGRWLHAHVHGGSYPVMFASCGACLQERWTDLEHQRFVEAVKAYGEAQLSRAVCAT
jgi:hypothetical protein